MAFRDITQDGLYRNGLKYEFTTEMARGVWKIYRKSDRMEFLAHDVTEQLFTKTKKGEVQETPLNSLLSPNGHNIITPLLTVLNHENLMSLVDVFALQFSGSGKLARSGWFIVWDYCDAGNLGNLLVRPTWRPDIPGRKKDDLEDEEMQDTSEGTKAPTEKKVFLPESLCWHVLLSVLKALAYLHDGARELHYEEGEFCMTFVDDDWQPMLHRNIKADNIFLSHPKRGEWYGACKLGNYSELVITGHFQGTEGLGTDTPTTKALAPSPGTKFTPLEELVVEDEKRGAVYPAQPGQPYTMVSEWRALVEVIQGMMIEPGTEVNHVEELAQYWLVDNLRDTGYSNILKNFLVKLMHIDPWFDNLQPDGSKEFGSSYVTSDLYCEAMTAFKYYRENSTEGANTVLEEASALLQGEQDAAERSLVQNSINQVRRVMNQMDPSLLNPPSKTI